MKYFTSDFLLFLKELEVNNHKDWFQANKERYHSGVEKPFYHFIEDLLKELETLMPIHFVTARDCIFRIYRDTRFSKDKTPYKTHMAAMISPKGRKDKTTPGMYVQVSTQDVRIYSGCLELNTQQLAKIRAYMLEHLEDFKQLISDEKFQSTFGEIRGEKYQRIPEPFAAVSTNMPLILNKSFYYFKKYAPETALMDDLLDILLSDYKNCQPLNLFFSNALEMEQKHP